MYPQIILPYISRKWFQSLVFWHLSHKFLKYDFKQNLAFPCFANRFCLDIFWFLTSLILEEIKAIEQKAAKSFNNMFKAMGDKQADFFCRTSFSQGSLDYLFFLRDPTIPMYGKFEGVPFNSVYGLGW